MIPHNCRAPTMDVVVYKGTKDVRKQLFRSKLKTKQFQVRCLPPISSYILYPSNDLKKSSPPQICHFIVCYY